MSAFSKNFGCLRIWIFNLALLLAAPRALFAQKPEEWIGKRVITRFVAVLRVDGKVIDNQKLESSPSSGQRQVLRLYRVEQSTAGGSGSRTRTAGPQVG